MLYSAGRAVDAVISRVWAAGVAGAGRLTPPVPRWVGAGGKCVMVIAPHPDDEVAGTGGTLALHRRAEDDTVVVHVTDGRGSRALGLGPDEMAARRHAEAETALRALGVTAWEWIGLREWDWADAEGVSALTRALAAHRPGVIYAPSRVDFHPEHRRVARALAAALATYTESAPAVRIYQVQVPLTRVLVNLVAPVAEVLPDTLRAAEEYASQAGSLRASLRLKQYAARSHGLAGGAEEFWEMSAGTYVALHAEVTEPPVHEAFRGFRRLSFTDPLAFALGRGERRHLRRLTESRRTDS
ncbi:MAG: PIG-L family deacetylase [Gemmatimonadetes bacterium]|nr:PIG-L family deacetylase [Gemmatimonadota bacterium]